MGGTIEHEYDGLDRLIAQTQSLGTMRYQYDALGRRRRMDAPGVAPVVYDYDVASRLTTITQAPLSPVMMDYDAAGRRTRLTLPNQVSTEYQYDPASQLTGLIYRNAAGLLGDVSYQYDGAGNRSQVTGSFARTLLPAAVASASYDAANRQLQFGDATLTFDLNGNTTRLDNPTGATAFTWDAQDRLVGVEAAGTQATFAYGFGRRLAKTVNAATTQYLYDGLDTAQAFDAQDTTSYLRSLAIDETLGFARRDGTFFSVHDPLDSVIAVTDAVGTPVTEYRYEPFGTTAATNATFANPFQYTGRENDRVAGLYYYRARYYDSGLHRFISEDPLEFIAGDVNLYAYVANSPTHYVDPMGLLLSPSMLPQECRDYHERTRERRLGTRKDGVAGLLGDMGTALNCDPLVSMTPTPLAVVGRVGAAKGLTLLSRDATGKLHGSLPRIKDLKNAPIDTIRENMKQLGGSILARKQELRQLGEHGPHRARIAQEESLLRSLEKRLTDLLGAKNAR